MEPYNMYHNKIIIKCTNNSITINFYCKEHIPKEDNRGDVANSKYKVLPWTQCAGHLGLGIGHVSCTLSCRSTWWRRPSFSTHCSSSFHTACPSGPPAAIPLVFLCDGSCYWGDSRSHQIQPMRNHQSSSNIKYSHVNRSTCKHLETQRGHDHLTIFMWLHWKSYHVFKLVLLLINKEWNRFHSVNTFCVLCGRHHTWYVYDNVFMVIKVLLKQCLWKSLQMHCKCK